MKTIHPNLFAQVMQFPDPVREDMLEFIGATSMEDAQVKQMIADVTACLQESSRTGQMASARI